MNKKYADNVRTQEIINENDENDEKHTCNQTLKINILDEEPSMPDNIVDAAGKENIGSYTFNNDNILLVTTTYRVSYLSYVTMNVILYRSIFEECSKHSIFTSLDNNSKTKKYFFLSSNNDINGPFSSLEMDNKFKDSRFDNTTAIRTNEDNSYISLSQYVKKYFYRMLANKTNKIQNESPIINISDRLKNTMFKNNKSFERNTSKPENRENRLVTTLPHHNLFFLNEVSNSETETENGNTISRARSLTLVN